MSLIVLCRSFLPGVKSSLIPALSRKGEGELVFANGTIIRWINPRNKQVITRGCHILLLPGEKAGVRAWLLRFRNGF